MIGLKLLDKLNLPATQFLKKGGKFMGELPMAQAAEKANMPVYKMFKKRYG
tara:strand:+ start:1581 stop:1733 length:153 start_codon:yes stop_codon:yes gene_type:complete